MKFHNTEKKACWRGFPVEMNMIDLIHNKLNLIHNYVKDSNTMAWHMNFCNSHIPIVYIS